VAVVTVYDLSGCPCCGGSTECGYVPCDCCPTAPSGYVSDTFVVTPDVPLEWDTGGQFCFGGSGATYDDDPAWFWSGPLSLVNIGSDCQWLYTNPVFSENSCSIQFAIQCDEGTWHLIGLVDGHTVTWELPDFDCCAPTQTITLSLVSADAVFTSLPTEVTVTNDCGCPECDCLCCLDGYWSQYTFTVAGIADEGTCPGCVDLNGTWTMTYNGPCSWVTGLPEVPFCAGTNSYWSLTCFEGTWRLENHVEGTVYTTTDDLCVDGGTLTLDFTGPGFCTDYPPTVTISPAGVFVPCPLSGGFSAGFSAGFSGGG
jgi:hypothetical protein